MSPCVDPTHLVAGSSDLYNIAPSFRSCTLRPSAMRLEAFYHLLPHSTSLLYVWPSAVVDKGQI